MCAWCLKMDGCPGYVSVRPPQGSWDMLLIHLNPDLGKTVTENEWMNKN